MAQAANTMTVLSSPAQAAQVGQDVMSISLWDAEVGGNRLHGGDITGNPSALALGERYEIAAGDIILLQPVATNETELLARRKAQGAVLGGIWVQYHSVAYSGTSDGTTNIIALGRTEIAQGAWTIT